MSFNYLKHEKKYPYYNVAIELLNGRTIVGKVLTNKVYYSFGSETLIPVDSYIIVHDVYEIVDGTDRVLLMNGTNECLSNITIASSIIFLMTLDPQFTHSDIGNK